VDIIYPPLGPYVGGGGEIRGRRCGARHKEGSGEEVLLSMPKIGGVNRRELACGEAT